MAGNNSSDNSDSVIRIQSIAQTAISQINHLVSLVEQRGTAATAENVSLTAQRSTPRAGTGNALEELRRRFPTLSRGTGSSRARNS